MRLDGGGWMLMRFGMTGSLAYFKSPEEEPSHSRLLQPEGPRLEVIG